MWDIQTWVKLHAPRPYVEKTCHECGQQIGGKGHVLRRDNEKDDGFVTE
jgi:hypothetical protein